MGPHAADPEETGSPDGSARSARNSRRRGRRPAAARRRGLSANGRTARTSDWWAGATGDDSPGSAA